MFICVLTNYLILELVNTIQFHFLFHSNRTDAKTVIHSDMQNVNVNNHENKKRCREIREMKLVI